MNKIILLNIEWNNYNGFILDVLNLDLYKPILMDHSLFGINVSKQFLIINILFIRITVFDKNEHLY